MIRFKVKGKMSKVNIMIRSTIIKMVKKAEA